MSHAVPLSLRIMAGLGLLAGALGVAGLVAPAAVGRAAGLRATPQSAYILRIAGTMLAALGLILVTFATAYWRAIR